MRHDTKVSILIVDDRQENLKAMEALLADPEMDLVVALTGNDALLSTLKTDFALVLLDVQMPGMDGFETAEWLRANPKTRHLPIIFITAGMKEDFHQFKGYEAGAVDYLMKPIEPALLKSKVKVFSDLARQRHQIEQHKRNLEAVVKERTATLSETVQALERSKERYQRLLESVTSYVYTVDLESGKPARTLHGPGCEAVTGHSPEDFQQWPTLWRDVVVDEDRATFISETARMLDQRQPLTFEHRIAHKDGSPRWVRSTLVPHLDADGTIGSYDGIVLDISERKKAEEDRHQLELRLFESQRLESLGTLAGGVAHDLNNVLAAILGLASIQREEADSSSPLAQSLDTITTACQRGGAVVKGLLQFARKSVDSKGPVDLNMLVRQTVQLLDATTLKRIQIRTELQEPLGLVGGDEGAFSHAVMNICLNALDAMPGAGLLVIETRSMDSGTIELSVQDSGEGMTPEVLKNAIDPFFTTKPVGKGTGLGLAMVYGTMKAHGGTLNITSEPGKGTKVVLGFQSIAEDKPIAPGQYDDQGPAMGSTRILLVDDDELIRHSIPAMLRALGHVVQSEAGGLEALASLDAGLEVDLVILDLRMPGLSGAETLPRLRALRPHLPVLLATGYGDTETQHLLAEDPNVGVIWKPFSMKELEGKLKLLLGCQVKH